MGKLSHLMTPEEAWQTASSLRPALCGEFHGGSCLVCIVSHFAFGFLRALKFYFPLHFLPLLLRFRHMLKE
jgi:hypothetical protein